VENDKASRVVAGDAAAVPELVDDVLNGSIVLEKLSTLNPDLRASLIAAEVDYRNGRHPGVSDDKVEVALNSLAKAAGAPAFAYTDTTEVRSLRMRLVPMVPNLFAHDLQKRAKDGKTRIRAEMSPAEGVYLLARLIDQKIYNPKYQLTADEHRVKSAELLSADEPSPRTTEIMDAVGITTDAISLMDLDATANDVVVNLGLRQNGGK